MLPELNHFIGGAIFLGDIAIALLFLRYWVRTRDRLFAWFGVAFGVLAVERLLLVWAVRGDAHPMVYLTRLIAFGAIIFAVIDRNRGRAP